MIKCLIVDDEPLAIQLLTDYVNKMDQLELVENFSNPLDALSFIQTNSIDLIFLDIQMPELNGVQFAKVIGSKSKIIFTTAYPDYAVKGFELNAVDYLVKPITFQRFIESVNRIANINNTSTNTNIKSTTSDSKKDFLMVKTEHRLQKINYADILYFKGMGDYVQIVTTDNKIMTLENMKSFAEKLPDNFIRVHKSYIISIDKIVFIEKNRIGIKEELIPISATYQEKFWEVMGKE